MEKEKLYFKKWFVILWLVLITPIGLLLLWKSPSFTQKGKKVAAIVSAIWFVILLLIPGPPSAESSYDLMSSEITYTTDDIPAQEAVYEDAKIYSTEMSGEYVIGTAPKDLVTGDEEEFTTAQSGKYTAGTDFAAGVYDIEVVSGNGNVQGSGLNEIMGAGTGYAGIDDMYVAKYDNKTFNEGDTLEVSGVSVKLVPQNKDDMVIIPGTYTMVATSGGGNVQGTGLNEIMGTEDKNDVIDMYVPQYDNKDFKEGDVLTVTGVSLDLQPKDDKVLVKEAVDAIPGHEQTERLESSPKGEICTVDGAETDCSDVAKYEELKSSLALESTITESVSLSNDKYTCKSDSLTVDCTELVDYENLVNQLAQK